jgi:hypothetical protein
MYEKLVFGHWSVKEMTRADHYLCVCLCGRKREIALKSLLSGNFPACECGRGSNRLAKNKGE